MGFLAACERYPDLRITLLPGPSHDAQASQWHVPGFVPAYSGGPVLDFHQIPFHRLSDISLNGDSIGVNCQFGKSHIVTGLPYGRLSKHLVSKSYMFYIVPVSPKEPCTKCIYCHWVKAGNKAICQRRAGGT